MGNKTEIWQGTLALMILKTIEALGPLHGYGIARRIEQTSGDRLSLNYGTLYPSLLKLEQEGSIVSEWGVSENNRKANSNSRVRAADNSAKKPSHGTADHLLAKFYAVGRQGMRQLRAGYRFKGFQKPRTELAAEIESHLQMHIDDNIRAGMRPGSQTSRVMKLGGMDQAKSLPRRRPFSKARGDRASR
jgi:hypothetical protein